MGLEVPSTRPKSTAAQETDGPTLLRRYFDAFNTRDRSGLRDVMATDVTEDYPQSGERIRGLNRSLEMLSRYRGVADGTERIVGDEERWVSAWFERPPPARSLTQNDAARDPPDLAPVRSRRRPADCARSGYGRRRVP